MILLLFIVAYKANEVSQYGWNRRFDRIPPTTDEHREYDRSLSGGILLFQVKKFGNGFAF
jgi:hypothetical protein